MEAKSAELTIIVNQCKSEFSDIKSKLDRAEENLRRYQKACSHSFKVTYDPIYHKGYTCPGDPPGTMGIDWRGPVHVPAETIPRWKRYCEKCDLTQYTQNTSEEVVKKPRW